MSGKRSILYCSAGSGHVSAKNALYQRFKDAICIDVTKGLVGRIGVFFWNLALKSQSSFFISLIVFFALRVSRLFSFAFFFSHLWHLIREKPSQVLVVQPLGLYGVERAHRAYWYLYQKKISLMLYITEAPTVYAINYLYPLKALSKNSLKNWNIVIYPKATNHKNSLNFIRSDLLLVEDHQIKESYDSVHPAFFLSKKQLESHLPEKLLQLFSSCKKKAVLTLGSHSPTGIYQGYLDTLSLYREMNIELFTLLHHQQINFKKIDIESCHILSFLDPFCFAYLLKNADYLIIRAGGMTTLEVATLLDQGWRGKIWIDCDRKRMFKWEIGNMEYLKCYDRVYSGSFSDQKKLNEFFNK